MTIKITPLTDSPLGKPTVYSSTYTPDLLCAIPRQLKRDALGIQGKPPFYGVDIWNAYEFSWLNTKGKPCVALINFMIPCTSDYLVESKSVKLYLMSFSQTQYPSFEAVHNRLMTDLSQATGVTVLVKLTPLPTEATQMQAHLTGESLDDQDLTFDTYTVNAEFLRVGKATVSEVLYSDLLKSNCLITGQPDWGSIQIAYRGPQIDRQGLLKYIVSFREHSGFAEHCAERVFMDILEHCTPQTLSVYLRYTRRGGMDINPYRSTDQSLPPNLRLCRQ